MAIPADDATRHTGMRRIVRLRLRPMSLHEAGRSSGAISLVVRDLRVYAQAADAESNLLEALRVMRICVSGGAHE